MSPLLFLVVVEGMSKPINVVKEEGKFEGVKIYLVLRITHLLFVDDALLFGRGFMEEWQDYKVILELFCNASGMVVSQQKSTFMEFGLDEAFLRQIKTLFPFQV